MNERAMQLLQDYRGNAIANHKIDMHADPVFPNMIAVRCTNEAMGEDGTEDYLIDTTPGKTWYDGVEELEWPNWPPVSKDLYFLL